MTEEHVPIALADAHASVGEHHVPAAIVHRSARTLAEEVDQELLLAPGAVLPAMRPEATQLPIGLQPGQQVIRHRRDRVVPTEALVKGLLLVGHRVLLESVGRCPFRKRRKRNGKARTAARERSSCVAPHRGSGASTARPPYAGTARTTRKPARQA